VVAVIRGEVKAGGVGLAAAADYLIGTETASFELAEVFFGVLPANVLPFLQGLRLSPGRARAMILSARKLNAAEALDLGLLDEVHPDDHLEKKTKELFKRLLMFSPSALEATKKLTLRLSGINLPALLKLTKHTLVDLLMNKKTQEGIEAFLEGGLPPWAGRFRPEHPLIVRE